MLKLISRAWRQKSLLLCAILLCAGGAYIALALSINTGTTKDERSFGDLRRDDVRQLRVYIEVLAVDAINDSMRLRISFAASPALKGRHPETADQDLKVKLGDGDRVQEIALRAHEEMAAANFEADLYDGAVASYPLDRFRAGLRIAAADVSDAPIPLHVIVWEGVAGWTLDIAQIPGNAAGEVPLHIIARRSSALRLLVLAIYIEMVLIGLIALTIGGVTFLSVKQPESTFTGALTGMVFALPVLRYTLPGTPPLGVKADLLVFFWAELAVALGLVLFVATWAQGRMRN